MSLRPIHIVIPKFKIYTRPNYKYTANELMKIIKDQDEHIDLLNKYINRLVRSQNQSREKIQLLLDKYLYDKP